MKKFEVNIFEEIVYTITVEAQNEEEARQKIWEGEVDYTEKDIVNNTVQQIEVVGEITK